VDDIAGFYESASIYICPIRDGGGTKLKILDALAHKLPLVAERIACEGLDIVDGVHALLSQDPQEMADNILYLLQNPQVAHELEKNGYDMVRHHYDFSSIGGKMSDLYSSLVNEVSRK
jgi:glycosyltransferase involved in cell wall biosynthesis